MFYRRPKITRFNSLNKETNFKRDTPLWMDEHDSYDDYLKGIKSKTKVKEEQK